MLIHGPSKAGKSLLAASTPAPRLYLDVEMAARFLPLRAVVWDPRMPPPTPSPEWDTAVVPVRTWADAVAAVKWLTSGKHSFISASLDSVSELQQRYLESIAGRGSVQVQQWGSALREVAGMIRDLRDLTQHPTNPLQAVVVTAMTKVAADGRYVPHLQGQLRDSVPYFMDITAFIDNVPGPNGVEERRLYTRKTPKYLAGERVGGRIPPILTLPDVSGSTLEEVASKNITFQALIATVYAGTAGIAAPAAVDTTPSDFSHGPILDADDVPANTQTSNNKPKDNNAA